MKRKARVLGCLVLMFALISAWMLSFNMAKAEEVDEDGLAIYQETEITTDGVGATLPFSVRKDAKAVFKFTVDKPSKLTVGMGTTGTAWAGATLPLVNGGIFFDESAANPVYECDKEAISEDESVTKHICVEPGVYYIIFSREGGPYTPQTGTVNAFVKLDKSIEGIHPDTIKKAEAVKQDVKYEDLATTEGTRNLYYKFTIKKSSRVHIYTSLASLHPEIKVPYKVDILDKNEVVKSTASYDTVDTVEDTTCLLEKGTYYARINFKGTYYGGDTSFRLLVNEVPSRPTVSALKAGARKITGTAEKKSKVYAVINGTAYSAKANASGKYSIKTPALKKGASVRVYAENSNGKGAVRTVKVK